MKAVIFDLDGTLLNTIDDIADSMNSVLAAYGLPQHNVDAYRMFVGDGVANLVIRATKGSTSDRDMLERIENEYRDELLKRQTNKTKPFSGIPELLSTLSERGIKISVLSNKPHDATEEVIAWSFPDISFSAVLGHRPGSQIKPDPSSVFELIDIMGVPPEEVLYIGDTGTDMQTAKAAGLRAIGVLWGNRGRSELEENGAAGFAEHPMDLLKYF